jgi:hypothetical protein
MFDAAVDDPEEQFLTEDEKMSDWSRERGCHPLLPDQTLAQATKQSLVAYKGGKCQDCGGIFPQCCYHFDHRIPCEKSFNIAEACSNGLTLVIPRLREEVDKCDLVCANCHALRTAGNPEISAKIIKGQKSVGYKFHWANTIKKDIFSVKQLIRECDEQ